MAVQWGEDERPSKKREPREVTSPPPSEDEAGRDAVEPASPRTRVRLL